ncbi:MAG: hypothetical protein AAF741_14125 [Bacteroidota bacterium]
MGAALAIGIGVLGLSPATLADMEPWEVGKAYLAKMYYDHHRDRAVLEAARLSGYLAVAPHLKKGSVRSPQDLMSFPWEEKAKPAKDLRMTDAQKRIAQRWDEQSKIKNQAEHGQ